MRSLSVFLVLALSTAAQATNWDVIDPIGNELLGTLVVTAPSIAVVPAKQIMPYTVKTGGPSAKVAQPDQPLRILAGDYCVHLQSAANSQKCGVKIVKKQTTTIGLSGFRFDWDKSKFMVSVGPVAEIAIAGDSGFKSQNAGYEPWMKRAPTDYAAGFDTRFSIQVPGFPMFQPQSAVVKDGQVEPITLAFPELRSTYGVKFPQRAFPEPTTCPVSPAYMVHRSAPMTGPFHTPFNVWTSGRWDESGRRNLVNAQQLVATSPIAKFFASKDGLTPLFYEIVVNNTYQTISSAAPIAIEHELKRIDVNDVFVTRENGTTYYVQGKWKLYRKDAAGTSQVIVPLGRKSACSTIEAQLEFPTKSGLDVVAGEYVVVVNYVTEEGPEMKEYKIDLR